MALNAEDAKAAADVVGADMTVAAETGAVYWFEVQHPDQPEVA